MLQKKKEEMRKKRRKRKDVDMINDNDDLIAAMIQNMKTAAEVCGVINILVINLCRFKSSNVKVKPLAKISRSCTISLKLNFSVSVGG